uniref:Uncharacterized protein n=1 Tax=mine drainage metagenome TaxID=410659 RepID=E6QNR9_9ZZZZ
MQKTMVFKEVQMLPFTIYCVMNRTRFTLFIRKARTTLKTNMQMQFFLTRFQAAKRNLLHAPRRLQTKCYAK